MNALSRQGKIGVIKDDKARADIALLKEEVGDYSAKIVAYLTQVRDALNNGNALSAIAILDTAILDFSTLG